MARGQKTVADFVDRHFTFGWWCLFGFVALGLLLDYFHAFKVGWYLDVGNESRRLMGTLAHAHGTLLGGLNIAYAVTIDRRQHLFRSCRIASPCLLSASLMIPMGFLLAGAFALQGEPGIGIFLVPIGGLLLVVSIGLTALSVAAGKSLEQPPATSGKRKKNS